MFQIEVTDEDNETYRPMSLRNIQTQEQAEIQLATYKTMYPRNEAQIIEQINT